MPSTTDSAAELRELCVTYVVAQKGLARAEAEADAAERTHAAVVAKHAALQQKADALREQLEEARALRHAEARLPAPVPVEVLDAHGDALRAAQAEAELHTRRVRELRGVAAELEAEVKREAASAALLEEMLAAQAEHNTRIAATRRTLAAKASALRDETANAAVRKRAAEADLGAAELKEREAQRRVVSCDVVRGHTRRQLRQRDDASLRLRTECAASQRALFAELQYGRTQDEELQALLSERRRLSALVRDRCRGRPQLGRPHPAVMRALGREPPKPSPEGEAPQAPLPEAVAGVTVRHPKTGREVFVPLEVDGSLGDDAALLTAADEDPAAAALPPGAALARVQDRNVMLLQQVVHGFEALAAEASSAA